MSIETWSEAGRRHRLEARLKTPGVSYTLGGQTWVMTEPPCDRATDRHNLLFRNKSAPQLARWVHPAELYALHQLGVVRLCCMDCGRGLDCDCVKF